MFTARTFQSRAKADRNRACARTMRHLPAECEKLFWSRVRDRRLGGHKIKRQMLVGSYIADFVCVEGMLIVELTAGKHADRRHYVKGAMRFCGRKATASMRICNIDVIENIDGVMDKVLAALESAPSP